MDNASDLAYHVGRALVNAGFAPHENPERRRDRWEFVTPGRDWPTWFRVTIEEVEYDREADEDWPLVGET